MDILDKVIQEWSYKTDKGYPDINNEKDIAVFESMFGIRLEKLLQEEKDKKSNSFDKAEYYQQYFKRLAPSHVDIQLQENTIIISNIIPDQEK